MYNDISLFALNNGGQTSLIIAQSAVGYVYNL